MIESVAGNLTQTGFSSGSVPRFGAQASKQAASGERSEGSSNPASPANAQVAQLTPEQQQQVQQLKQTDRNVRAHEQAHLSVGADLVRGGPTFTYETGPDKKNYAVAGEVSIDTSPGRTPEETIPKAVHIRATALAPADPSPQDHSVAAQASRMESNARMELAVQQRDRAADADQGSAGFYTDVAQASAAGPRLGGSLDLFA